MSLAIYVIHPMAFGQVSCQQILHNDVVHSLVSQARQPHEPTENSKAILWESIASITQHKPAIQESWISVSGVVVPVARLRLFHSTLKSALSVQFSLADFAANELAARLELIAIDSLNVPRLEYQKYQRSQGTDLVLSKRVFIQAVQTILGQLEINREYDIPYVAGYSQASAKQVYIDRSIRPQYELSDGQTIDVVPFLALHEAIEKTLMLSLSLHERSYYQTHQLAQRLEKEFILASGFSWQHYQRELMREEMERIYRKPVLRVPHDLDLTPYIDGQEVTLLTQMNRAKVLARPLSKLGEFTEIGGFAKIQLLAPGIYHLMFPSVQNLAETFLRPQEFYESARFSERFFELTEFVQWYKTRHGEFDYYQIWDGFNFPAINLRNFKQTYKGQLSSQEQKLIEVLDAALADNVYFIATAENSETQTIHHEYAHALYYTNAQYRQSVTDILNKEDLQKLFKFLGQGYGDYHQKVLLDEAHAWLMHNFSDLSELGFETRPLQSIHHKLLAIYREYQMPGLEL